MGDLLEVLRVQRHDFLNHLQVILGYLQLKKFDRAQDYLKEVAEELVRAGVIARLDCSEVVKEILAAQLAADKRGVVLNNRITTGLDRGVEAPLSVAEIIGEMLKTAVKLVETSPCIQGVVDFEIAENNGEYQFRVSFRCSESTGSLALASGLVFMEEAAVKSGCRLSTGHSADGLTVISLAVPAGRGSE